MNLYADSSRHPNRSHPRPQASPPRQKAFCPEVTWQALHPVGAGCAGIRALTHGGSDAGRLSRFVRDMGHFRALPRDRQTTSTPWPTDGFSKLSRILETQTDAVMRGGINDVSIFSYTVIVH